jgi:hypothetical protein
MAAGGPFSHICNQRSGQTQAVDVRREGLHWPSATSRAHRCAAAATAALLGTRHKVMLCVQGTTLHCASCFPHSSDSEGDDYVYYGTPLEQEHPVLHGVLVPNTVQASVLGNWILNLTNEPVPVKFDWKIGAVCGGQYLPLGLSE